MPLQSGLVPRSPAEPPGRGSHARSRNGSPHARRWSCQCRPDPRARARSVRSSARRGSDRPPRAQRFGRAVGCSRRRMMPPLRAHREAASNLRPFEREAVPLPVWHAPASGPGRDMLHQPVQTAVPMGSQLGGPIALVFHHRDLQSRTNRTALKTTKPLAHPGP